MDVNKLIERLRTESLYKDKATLEIMDLCMDAAEALSTLRADLEHVAQKYETAAKLQVKMTEISNRQRAELERVKREGMSMERLTARNKNGLAMAACCEKNANTITSASLEDLASVGKCVEEITEFEGITVDRLRELAQADRDGRCVVQKFSPGQTVWVIERNEYGEAYDLSGYVFVTSLRGIALVSPKINGSPEIDVILMDQVESRINYDDGCIVAYPADDCYLSREAAEKALGEDARRQEEKHSGY